MEPVSAKRDGIGDRRPPVRGGTGPAFILAGGGTGGHLFPAVAVARELESRIAGVSIYFVVGRKPMELATVRRYGFRGETIGVEGLKGRGWRKASATLLKLPGSLFRSVSIIRRIGPRAVLGTGAYSSGPVCLAARLMGVPAAIHEQNAYPGLTNRLLARIVDRVFISFEESRRHLRARRIFLTGNPVREELLSAAGGRERGKEGFTILVVGGSQGARAVNRAFAEALQELAAQGRCPEVIHQTGKADYGRVMADYRERGLRGEIVPFIEDMAAAYRRADFVVGRAGATTLFELAAMGKPSLLIPYPFAANGHQETNARSLVAAGGAEMMTEDRLTGRDMARILSRYMDDPEALESMGLRARSMGRPFAAGVIVDHLLEMAGT